MTDEYHCQDLKEQEDDLNISSRRSSEKVSCGTRSRPSGCYAVFLFKYLLPAKSDPPVMKRIELIGSGTTV